MVEECGPEADRFERGRRVGVPWLYSTCGACRYCTAGKENLCPAALFTGLDVDGGYAEYVTVHEDYAYDLPAEFSDSAAAPLLCGGRYRISRTSTERRAAGRSTGTLWVWCIGTCCDSDCSPLGLPNLCFYSKHPASGVGREIRGRMGGSCGGDAARKNSMPRSSLHRQEILCRKCCGCSIAAERFLWPESTCLRSRVFLTRSSMENALFVAYRIVHGKTPLDLLRIAGEIPIRTEVESFELIEANQALAALKRSEIDGAAVLSVSGA